MTYFYEIQNPLDQFTIRDFISLDAPILGNIHLSLTNITLYMLIAFFIILLINIMVNKYAAYIHFN
jgi:F-type H+-transporting ATPase subunit a